MSAQLPVSPSLKRSRFEGSESGETDDTTYHGAPQECNRSANTLTAAFQQWRSLCQSLLLSFLLALVYTQIVPGACGLCTKAHGGGVCMTAPVHFPGNASCTRMNMAAYGNLLLVSGGHGQMSLPAADSGKPGHAQAR